MNSLCACHNEKYDLTITFVEYPYSKPDKQNVKTSFWQFERFGSTGVAAIMQRVCTLVDPGLHSNSSSQLLHKGVHFTCQPS